MFIPPIPSETSRLAKAAFGRSNFYIQVGEHADEILENIHLERSTPTADLARNVHAIFALVTFFQFIEGLIDDQALEALRMRIEWKYALHFPLHAPIFHRSALCNLRQRIQTEPASQREFQKLIDRLALLEYPFNNKPGNFESLYLVQAVCSMNRIESMQEAMCQTIEILAIRFPARLRQIALPHWYGRYKRPVSRFGPDTSLQQKELFFQQTGADIHHLLQQIDLSDLHELSELNQVNILRQIWEQQFEKWNQIPVNERAALMLSRCTLCIHKIDC